MANIKDIAALAGVGVGTVSRVINDSGSVSDVVRAKINAAIKQLNYVPNSSAQSLRSGRAGIVGLFIPVLNNPFFCLLADRVEALLDSNGYKTLIVCSQSDKNKELQVLNLLGQNRVDGAIFVTHHNLGDIDEKLALVTIDRHLGDNFPCITSDNYQATMKAIEYLRRTGCKHIAYAGGRPVAPSEVELRRRAYLDCMRSIGQDPLILYEPFDHGEDDVFAERFFEKIGNKADAVICSGDTLAYAVYQSAVRRGLSVPADFRIVSYDGVLKNWVRFPNISAITQDVGKMAECAIRELIHKIEGRPYEKKVIVPAEFRIGDTT